MNTHHKGLIITTLGVLFIVPDSLFVRLINTDPMVTAFWRALTSGIIIFVGVVVFQGFSAFKAVLQTGRAGWIYMALIGTTAPGFVMAITYTSVANAVFIFATIPIFAAIFSRIYLGEPVQGRMVATMAAVFIGLGLVAYGSLGSQIASWKGDLWAIFISAAYAGALTALRKLKATSMIPAIPIAYLGTALVIGSFTAPLSAFQLQWPLFLGHGAFIGVATCFLTLGPRYLNSPEVSLLILLESVLAPILVWAVIGEDPGALALAGGAVVIGALLVSNILILRKRARIRR